MEVYSGIYRIMIDKIDELYTKFLNGGCSKEELMALLDHFKQHGEDSPLKARIYQELLQQKDENKTISEEGEKAIDRNWKALEDLMRTRPSKRQVLRWRTLLPYAAAVVFLMGGLFIYIDVWFPSSESEYIALEDREPASSIATLTLSDGRYVQLDTLSQGLQVEDRGVILEKVEEGVLHYSHMATANSSTTMMHTISTPMGGTYRVMLQDRSTIWLNAGSSISYAVNNQTSERRVSLYGEAFFDIERNPLKPFIVQTEEEEVKVLGTSFNVAAYDRARPVTTLASGRVSIIRDDHEQSLSPQQQAVWTGREYAVKMVDIQQYVSWKDGWFIFHDVPLKDIMQQVQRWYNVEVDYTHIPDERFYVEFGRHEKLSSLLEMIETSSDMKFQLKGGKISMK